MPKCHFCQKEDVWRVCDNCNNYVCENCVKSTSMGGLRCAFVCPDCYHGW